MAHNANTTLLGTTRSNIKDVTSRKGTNAAGIAVRLKSDGTLSVTKADGNLLGVSLGIDQSDTDKIAICRRGVRVPLRLTAAFTPAIGAIVYISDVTGLAKASATDSTAVNATYTALLSDGAIVEDGSSSVAAALVDFEGGL